MGFRIISPRTFIAPGAAARTHRLRGGKARTLEQRLDAMKTECAASIGFAVFEPNDAALWARVAAAIEAVLFKHWQAGALLGSKPEQGFHVRCDQTSHRPADLAAGHVRALVGVAPLKPAEYIIFAVASATADRPA